MNQNSSSVDDIEQFFCITCGNFFLQKIYYELKSDTGKGSGEAADQKFLDFFVGTF